MDISIYSMSRQSLVRHVLRFTRKLYGLSREKLAAKVGCAPITIKQIETGKLKPSPTLAHRIYMQTGLNPDQLMKNSWPERPMHPGGEELTPDYMERMDEIRKKSESQHDVDMQLRLFTVVLESGLDASLAEDKYWAIVPALQATLDRVFDDFGLKNAFQKLLKARWGVEDPWAIRHPALSLYVKVNMDQETGEKAAAIRKKFFRNRDSKQKRVKPVRQKTLRLPTRQRSTA
jgi:DNA-binding XRE family transcriptional regulator